jgi:predicted kinase
VSTLVITRGLPGAGKTTFAKQWVTEEPKRARVNRDDLRRMLFVNPNYGEEQEKLVTTFQRDTIKHLLKAGYDVIADDTNLPAKRCREWFRFAAAHRAVFGVKDFEISVEESIARQANRPEQEQVAPHVIYGMARFLRDGKLQQPDYSIDAGRTFRVEPYEPDISKPAAIIVDIDGTLALHDRRSPYDLSLVHTDKPNPPVVEAVVDAFCQGKQIIFLSGREDSSRKETEEWLHEHVLDRRYHAGLHMRATGDGRKDSIVKQELFDKHVRYDYNVVYVLDDRQQVVDMWREIGLTCLQVAPGEF